MQFATFRSLFMFKATQCTYSAKKGTMEFSSSLLSFLPSPERLKSPVRLTPPASHSVGGCSVRKNARSS